MERILYAILDTLKELVKVLDKKDTLEEVKKLFTCKENGFGDVSIYCCDTLIGTIIFGDEVQDGRLIGLKEWLDNE